MRTLQAAIVENDLPAPSCNQLGQSPVAGKRVVSAPRLLRTLVAVRCVGSRFLDTVVADVVPAPAKNGPPAHSGRKTVQGHENLPHGAFKVLNWPLTFLISQCSHYKWHPLDGLGTDAHGDHILRGTA